MSSMNNQELSKKAEKKRNHVEYGKYGYLFIAPFFYSLFIVPTRSTSLYFLVKCTRILY